MTCYHCTEPIQTTDSPSVPFVYVRTGAGLCDGNFHPSKLGKQARPNLSEIEWRNFHELAPPRMILPHTGPLAVPEHHVNDLFHNH